MTRAIAIGCSEHLGVRARELAPRGADFSLIVEYPNLDRSELWLPEHPEAKLLIACVGSHDVRALQRIQALRMRFRYLTLVALFDVENDLDTARGTVGGLLASALPAADSFRSEPGERLLPASDAEAAPVYPQQPPHVFGHRLTPRQLDVLYLIRQGHSNKEIARVLDLSEGTVKIHCMSVFRELGVCNRTQAAIMSEKFELNPPQRDDAGAASPRQSAAS